MVRRDYLLVCVAAAATLAGYALGYTRAQRRHEADQRIALLRGQLLGLERRERRKPPEAC